jgi:hypothetical protein
MEFLVYCILFEGVHWKNEVIANNAQGELSSSFSFNNVCSGQQVRDLFLTVPEDLFVTVHEEDHSKKFSALFVTVTVQRAITWHISEFYL